MTATLAPAPAHVTQFLARVTCVMILPSLLPFVDLEETYSMKHRQLCNHTQRTKGSVYNEMDCIVFCVKTSQEKSETKIEPLLLCVCQRQNIRT